jgi:ATP-binding cassette, subfamily B, bacterial MsbA
MNNALRMFGYIFRYKALFAVSIFFSMLYAVTNAGSIYLIGPFLQTIFGMKSHARAAGGGFFGRLKADMQSGLDSFVDPGNPTAALTKLCILIVIIILLKNFFSYFQGYIMAFVEQGVIRDLRRDVYAAYHRLPLRFFQKRRTGDMLSRVINDCSTVNDNFNSAFIELIKEPINIACLLGVMVFISWKLTLFTFLIAPPSLLVIMWIGKKLRRRTTLTQDRISELTSVIEETISNIRVVKAFAMETFELLKFDRANNSYFRALIRLFRIRRLSSPVTEFLGVTMVVVVLWIGGNLVLAGKGELAPDQFILFIGFMFMLMQAAKRLSEVNVKMQVGIAAAGRVFEIIDRKSEVVDPPSPIPLDTLREGVRFEGVWYEYEPGKPVLREIDLDVRTGEHIAIVGPSGAGKSTLLDLLPRFFDPTRGAVKIDGQDIRGFRLDDLRRLYGIVTQETMLFHDTIRANIAYGRPDISFEEIAAAARTAHADGFITGFEKGYDSEIGDRGTKLSGGQKQRLAIARAVLKNPPILLFDEATSALDSESEAEVQSAIESLMRGRTSFVIAHRLSTIQNATRIVVIDHGKIVGTGTHGELYERLEIYRRMYDLQFSGHASGQ